VLGTSWGRGSFGGSSCRWRSCDRSLAPAAQLSARTELISDRVKRSEASKGVAIAVDARSHAVRVPVSFDRNTTKVSASASHPSVCAGTALSR